MNVPGSAVFGVHVATQKPWMQNQLLQASLSLDTYGSCLLLLVGVVEAIEHQLRSMSMMRGLLRMR
jgi:hypothetical protein